MISLNFFVNMSKRYYWSRAWKTISIFHDPSPLIRNFPRSEFYFDQSNSDLLRQVNERYLVDSGFIESIQFRRPQRKGLPIPWFTFSAIDFLETINLRGMKVLEVGGGFSTLYWARRGLTGHTLECDPNWCSLLKSTQNEGGFQNSIELIQIDSCDEEFGPDIRTFIPEEWLTDLDATIGQSYLEESEQFFRTKQNLLDNLTTYLTNSDLVVIDGISRNLCMMLAAQLSPSHALIILDNSDRVEYALGQEILISAGWKATRFSGLGPMNPYQWETTIFSQ